MSLIYPGVFHDGDFTLAEQNGAATFEYPFDWDPACKIVRVPYHQRADMHVPPSLGFVTSFGTFISESPTRDEGAGICSFTRDFLPRLPIPKGPIPVSHNFVLQFIYQDPSSGKYAIAESAFPWEATVTTTYFIGKPPRIPTAARIIKVFETFFKVPSSAPLPVPGYKICVESEVSEWRGILHERVDKFSICPDSTTI